MRAINYDHDGTPDGIQLANGDLVRFGPGAQMDYKPNQSLTIEGDAEALPGGGRLIHPHSINGTTVSDAPPAPPAGGPGGGPPGGRQGPGVRGGSPAQQGDIGQP